MKIQSIETFPVLIPLKPKRRMRSALGAHTESKYVLVRVRTDNGIEGIGEATVMPLWSGETVWGSKALIDQLLGPALLGMEVTDIAQIVRTMDRIAAFNWFSKAALEMACWDILGKSTNKPVYELLGGPERSRSIVCRFSMGAYPEQRAQTVAKELIAAGFHTIKIKVGTDPAEDIRRVACVREVIGSEREIYLDANCGWDSETAIEAMAQLDQYRIAVFEQPTPLGDYAALARVRRAISPMTKVMADDIVFDWIHAKECIRNEAVDIISVYPGKCGGILKTKQIVDLADQHGIPCSIGSNLEWDIATAAMCHLVVACANMQVEQYPGDILGPEYHQFSIARNPIDIEGPKVTVSDRPGLGIDVDWKVVEEHLCE